MDSDFGVLFFAVFMALFSSRWQCLLENKLYMVCRTRMAVVKQQKWSIVRTLS